MVLRVLQVSKTVKKYLYSALLLKEQLIVEGVDGIITDYPDSLKLILDELDIP